MSDKLLVQTRIFDLLNWLLPKSERFPRVYRNTLGLKIMNSAMELSEFVAEAQAMRSTERYHALCKADARLTSLRMYLRLIHRWKWINDGQYRHVSAMLEEIGRLLGGWIRRAGKEI